MTDRAWFDAAKGDIPQWAASMPKDADGTTIDWDWVRSLDLAHGVGTIPESTPQSIHDALPHASIWNQSSPNATAHS